MEQVHVVMVPFPLQSHIRPMLHFAKALVAKQKGVMVTMVNNKHHHDRIYACMREPENDPLYYNVGQEQLNFVWVENGLPLDFDYGDLSCSWEEYHAGFANMKSPLVFLLRSLKNPPVSCVVFGSFCPWAPSFAAELCIPSAFFWTQSATVFSIYYHATLLASHDFFPCKIYSQGEEQDDSLISYIPGVAPIHPSSLPSLLHVDSLDDITLRLVRDQFEALRECDAVIINSCAAVEKEAFLALQSKPFSVHLVGPLIPCLDALESEKSAISIDIKNEKCLKWLEGQKKRSVLYICFGSVFDPSAVDVQAIALALKANKQPFLWAIKPKASMSDVSDMLPDNFLEETKEYGMVVAWAPQLHVLSHVSVAAFLTHCGWNSVLEGLSMGVPMLCLPTSSDQPTNGSLVVNTWKAGLCIKKDLEGHVDSDEVSSAVRSILSNSKIQANACKLKEVLRDSLQAGGVSHCHLQNFVDVLRRKPMKIT